MEAHVWHFCLAAWRWSFARARCLKNQLWPDSGKRNPSQLASTVR
jgi:hypothetical protein